MLGSIDKQQRQWLVAEVVQISSMDCGPASLKCLLEGFHIPISYGRLREACQTSVDGTSIDKLEEVANQLGLFAEQVMLPLDHITLPAADVLPAIVVARQADGATHFVVLWRRVGQWIQIMDPATGRRWLRSSTLLSELFVHQHTVTAADWRDWAGSDDFIQPLNQRIQRLGANQSQANQCIETALIDPEWFGLARLDAAVRLVMGLITADGIKPGTQALKLLHNVFNQTDKQDIYRLIPITYWNVVPQNARNDGEKQLRLKGAVLLKIQAAQPKNQDADYTELPAELAAALQEKPISLGATLWQLLRADGLLTPLALLIAIAVSAAAVLLESLLFRGIFDIAWELRSPEQRLLALLSLLAFTTLLLLLEVPIAHQALRIGRHFETRLRIALLSKMPRLNDRYFHSRPISDLAERGHSIAATRTIPNLAVQLSQTVWDLLFTLIGIAFLDSASGYWAFAIVLIALVLPLLAQPLLNERDSRARSHAGALFSFYLDALLGLVPIRAHSAETAVRREHEGLLTEWTRANRCLIQVSLVVEAMQAVIGTVLVCTLLYQHFLRSGSIMGGDLLLVYWALKLPAIGQRLTHISQQYPAQRNSLLRLLEPLETPEDPVQTNVQHPPAAVQSTTAAELRFEHAAVMAGGHHLLHDLTLHIKPGEHIAIVGPSGAGKSTLLGLLLGWHKISGGQLNVDGITLSASAVADLRRHTAWVDPAIQLWNRSVLDNLSFSSPEYDIDDLGRVLDAASLRGVLQKLPSGLQTLLGEGGGLLSGGEGQRLRLARALLQRHVRLVLLDEPFRGLDRPIRQQLLAEVRSWWSNATLLCVTHDLQETQAFDRVLVIENGTLIEDGSPSQLCSAASRYADLCHSERNLLETQWHGSHWRSWTLSNGQICETAS